MNEPLVIGLDSSTRSAKAIAWDPHGRAVAEGRADIPMANPRADWLEQDPADWWRSAVVALRGCTDGIDPTRVEGLAISNQRETLGFFDAAGEPTHAAILWLDGRAKAQVTSFAERFGAGRIHRITGRPPDLTSCLYRFAWMREHLPDVYARTAAFVDVQAYLVRALCGGGWRTGRLSSDPMGIFDLERLDWSSELLEALDLDPSRLPAHHAPGARLGELTRDAAAATGLPVGTPVFAAGGDGQLAGLGAGCTVPERSYVNLGTAVVSGIWSSEYRYDRAWRTELAAQGLGYILETCLRSGAWLVDWFVDRFAARGVDASGERAPRADAATFARLEREAARLPIGAEGLLLQPYFAGAMDPHWNVDARGALLGLSTSHGEAHLYRAILEGITLSQVAATDALERAAGQRIDHHVAIGGGATSELWRQMLADASGRPVHVSDTVEASALGAGMLAAFGAGWYHSIEAAASAMTGETTAIEPDAARNDRYRELLAIHRDLYAATLGIGRRLTDFAASAPQETIP